MNPHGYHILTNQETTASVVQGKVEGNSESEEEIACSSVKLATLCSYVDALVDYTYSSLREAFHTTVTLGYWRS